jgi:DNA polymerase-3 subunit epsilon
MTNKEQAESNARLIMQQNPLFLDTETTGLRSDAEICEIAVIDHQGNVILDQLVKPRSTIPPDAARIHGITDDDVSTAPGFEDVWRVLAPQLAGRTVVIYNADYDLRLLDQSLTFARVSDKRELYAAKGNSHCAMKLYAEYYGDWNDYRNSYRWQRLEAAATQCGLSTPTDLHRAKADATLTLHLMQHMSG